MSETNGMCFINLKMVVELCERPDKRAVVDIA
jgi:hypothetical protein